MILKLYLAVCVLSLISLTRGQTTNDPSWGEWSRCSRTCGGAGTQYRFQSPCRAEPCYERRRCNTEPCHTGIFTIWTPWSRCSRTCGGGTQTRKQSICRSQPCTQSRKCNTQRCTGSGDNGQSGQKWLSGRFEDIVLRKVKLLADGWKNRSSIASERPTASVQRQWNQLLNKLAPYINGTQPTTGRTKRQAGTLCQRKEYRQLTRIERKRLHRAIRRSMKSNIYLFLVSLHNQAGAHGGPAFLPWHRVYLLLFELLLRSYDSRVCLAYWDSTLDNDLPDPHDSIMWSPEFMGNVFNMVNISDFAYWPTRRACHNQLGIYTPTLWRALGGRYTYRYPDRRYDRYPFYYPYYAYPYYQGRNRRYYDSRRQRYDYYAYRRNGLYRDSDITYFLSFNQYADLVNSGFETAHGGVHGFVGGHMGDLVCSPSDPVFWLHHTFIDCVWQWFRDNQSPPLDAYVPGPWHPAHAPGAPMTPFSPLTNKAGMGTWPTDFFYGCRPRPVNCASHSDCGHFLFCDRGRCRSKVKTGGDCTGYPANSEAPCECGQCYRYRGNYICMIITWQQWLKCALGGMDP